MSKSNHSVSGSWLGNYYYERTAQGYGFEAVFVEMNGSVEGSILDDGRLGEAHVFGSFAAPHLCFAKKYDKGTMHVVEYQGELSEDGKKLQGTWQIGQSSHGIWHAWRQDEETVPEFERTDELDDDKEEARPKVMVAPASFR